MKNKKHLISAVILSLIITISFAHSGRTDSSGGHKDNKNASGLGSYHYHCGGYPAHLHSNGYCPYTNYNSTPIYTPTTSVTIPQKTNNKISVNSPSYPVKINGENITNYCGNWEPFVYKDITYMPMTSSVMQELGLTSSFNSITGFDVSNKKSQFLDDYIVIIPTNSNTYHKYGCPYLDLSSFSACDIGIAETCDFIRCNYCCGV